MSLAITRLKLIDTLADNQELKKTIVEWNKVIVQVIGSGNVELLYGLKTPECMTQPDEEV